MQNSTIKIKILIVGAGKAGELIAGEIKKNKSSAFEIVGFIDDDKTKQGETINGLRVLGPVSDLSKLIKLHNVHELFIAIPSERGESIRNIINNTHGSKISYKILPRLSEVLIQDFTDDYLKFIRRVKPEDLLGGEILKSDQQEITDFTKGQVILITGAAGSIGSELSRQVVAHKPKKILLYDWWENGMFDLGNQLLEGYPDVDIELIIGDVKDKNKVNLVMKIHQPDTVFHAAAYKHVPLMEKNPVEAIKNNIFGTKTVAESAIKHRVKKFILVSTDKAVNPTSIMGATKRAAEMLVHIFSESQSNTIFCAVRFGNVINSNGSAIPTFEKQIENGGPVTVTHKEITRYFMTIPEAVHLILQSWVVGKKNDLFVLDMGEPIKIYELARLLIILHGYEPDKEVAIEITGLRPGEKLYEELLIKEEEVSATTYKKIFKTQNYNGFDKLVFLNQLTQLLETIKDQGLNNKELKVQLKKMVPAFKPKAN
jgi:FlaA1/EpsC-like NDP-sugar epimerase